MERLLHRAVVAEVEGAAEVVQAAEPGAAPPELARVRAAEMERDRQVPALPEWEHRHQEPAASDLRVNAAPAGAELGRVTTRESGIRTHQAQPIRRVELKMAGGPATA
jgi:hypothetical protein